ncbi:MAG TPA: patatin-like phospholipase family protein [Oscillatoriaceae cyanobacterium M33_DOE_052]|uniref:Patatin-like phospholipase family protein n=1 Tax=Planktothricoides sp. SpSt-374 TaxID=2282167 RepID=A0A7C3VI47_9CYAN|nr:patatin-like phospholipase family protein [Oscillatoriaceae cyanobacterium M33_DOE_052]
MEGKKKLAIACQGGGSHTAFTAGVLKKVLEQKVYEKYNLVGLSGTSGGAICATLAWFGLLKLAQGETSQPVYQGLVDFWAENSAINAWERSLNNLIIESIRLQDMGTIPAFSSNPYSGGWLQNTLRMLAPRKEYLDFKALLEKHIPFQQLHKYIKADSPRLLLGAVNVLSGEFKAFDSWQNDEISIEAVQASAAIPNVFQAVQIGNGAYWDGLFSQNPPISPFIDDDHASKDARPEEIWIVQINPKERKTEPTTAEEILDRRNELGGNLSLFQEMRFIEIVNDWIREGAFSQEYMERVKPTPIDVRLIQMSDELSDSLDYASKLDRSPAYIQRLMADGEKQAEVFLNSLNS